MSNAFSPEGFGLRADTKIRTAGKMVFRVFHTMHYLKSPKCFLISISRKLQCQSGILHCQKQLISEEKEGKLKVPRFFGETGGKHTFSNYRFAKDLQNEILLEEERSHEGLKEQPRCFVTRLESAGPKSLTRLAVNRDKL